MTRRSMPFLSDPKNADGLARRDFLRLGGLAAASTVSGWAGLPTTAVAAPAAARMGKARSCILIYLLDGPPHLDMWDLKPNAPAEVRGPFQPIPTNVPGIQICEHLPRLARSADKFALLRAVSHPNNNHTPMIYYTLTGHHVENPGVDNDVSPQPRRPRPLGPLPIRRHGRRRHPRRTGAWRLGPKWCLSP